MFANMIHNGGNTEAIELSSYNIVSQQLFDINAVTKM